MRRLLILWLAGAAAPAMAQHAQHGPQGSAPASTATCTPEHAAMGHCELPADAAPTAPAAKTPDCSPEHAAMGHCTLLKEPEPAPPAACAPEHAAMGHCTMPAQEGSRADPHAGHGATGAAPPIAPPPAEAFSGPENAADAVFGQDAMQVARERLVREHGDMRFSKVLIDQLEARMARGRGGYFLNAEAWYGSDINKLWLKSEVEGKRGRKPEKAEVQAFWSRAIDPWFDVQAGVRFDANPDANRTHLVLGVQGLAPYWWEVDGAVFLSNKGEVTARAEAEYDLRITQKLILQPRVEADVSAQDIEELGIGSGLSTVDAGLRLRYQIGQQFAPYVGVIYERAFGRTRALRKADDERANGLNVVAGLRWWF